LWKILFINEDLTLALAGLWRPLQAGAGRGGAGRAPGWSFLFLKEQIKDIIIIMDTL
jgi:hypothetical protein